MFLISLCIAAYLGFALIELKHDKLIHFTTFFILTSEFYFIFDTKYKSLKTLRYITFLTCTLCASLNLEIVQNMVNPERVFDFADVVYNFFGSLSGLLVSITLQTWRLKLARANRIKHRRLHGSGVAVEIGQEIENLQEGPASKHVDVDDDYVNIEMKDVS